MQKSIQFFLGILAGLVLAGIVVALSVFLWNWVNPISYISPGTTVSAPTDITGLAARVEQLEIEQDYQLKVFEWKQDQKLLVLGWTAVFISFIAAFLGLKTYNDLDKVIREKVNSTLEHELYQLDPTNLKIWLIAYKKPVKFRGEKEGEMIDSDVEGEMQKVRQRIELSGLVNIKALESPDHKCYQGVTIIPVFDKVMEAEFREFLARNSNLDPKRAAFILYTRDYRVSQKDTLDKYANLVTANMPPTAASMILTVGRGLKNENPAPIKEGA